MKSRGHRITYFSNWNELQKEKEKLAILIEVKEYEIENNFRKLGNVMNVMSLFQNFMSKKTTLWSAGLSLGVLVARRFFKKKKRE